LTYPTTLRELASALNSGQLTPDDALGDTLDSIAATEPDICAWVTVDTSGAARQVRELQRTAAKKGPLWGVPVAIKDLIDVEGLPTRCGSPLRGAEVAAADAGCVELLRAADAVIIGKTVTTEFGYFSPGPTRNPVNKAHTPGGSSSGSAAAVAAGHVRLALGTQTAGSLTRPASYCGVAGFVTAKDQLPTSGITGLSPTLDSVGLLARTVNDLKYAWEALNGIEAAHSAALAEPVELLRWDGSELGEISSDMAGALATAASLLARDSDFHFSDWPHNNLVVSLAEQHGTVMAKEAAAERSGELEQLDRISAPFANLLTSGRLVPEPEYKEALDGIATARQTVLGLLERFDAIIGPAALGAAPAGIHATGSPVLSRPWQALGLPVITVPGLHDGEGMPLGLQLIGVPGREERLFDIGARIEEVLRNRIVVD
jgi:Asp-tRNA(Asn)/Glu-tRNA(Gln) amidotransferase A subunit family amidase